MYWTNEGTSATHFTDGSIMRVAVDGSGLTTLATGPGHPQAMAVDATSVYWTDFYGTTKALTPK